ncbi:hypothetical protein BMS3Abin08_01647 [bacterium BMS3Abin08]|nr:hypothetical protein BMS3Abin08_01647 [bacterium BMS3Abin08]
MVTLTATSAANSSFTGWTGCDSVLDGKCTIKMTSGRAVTAEFFDDGDGVPPGVEDGGPNGGDGNDDGTSDSLQGDVTTLKTADGLNYATVSNTNGAGQTNVQAVDPPADAPSGIVFPYGMFEFTVTGIEEGGTVHMEVYVPYDPVITGYWKKNVNTGQSLNKRDKTRNKH